MWKITTQDSQLVSKNYADEIQAKWEFSDPILQSIAGPIINQKTMLLPSSAFRENAKYSLRLNLTNSGDLTLNRVQEITFVPLSCQYFLVNGFSADQFYYSYVNPQSTENITFFLQLVVAKPYCSEIAFFKDLTTKNLSYQIVYGQDIPAGQIFDSLPKPNLSYVWDEKQKRFIVTLPKTEQYKIPLRTDVKFIFSIPWMNSEHNEILPTTNLVFQNALVTINFQKEGSVLIPFLDVPENVITRDESAIFNASRSYLTYRSAAEKQSGLSFKWICPFPLDLFCRTKTENTLIIETNDFLNAKASFNLTYNIQLRIEWINLVNGTGYLEFAELESPVKWLNYSVPTFTLEGPPGGVVKVSSDFIRFQVLLKNYEIPDLSILNVEWSIVPNISVAKLPLKFNNTLLTLVKGQLSPLTSYTMTVTISNKLYKMNPKVQILNFVTSQPPVGGTVNTVPAIGIVGETQFNLTIQNWESMNRPLRYQVWSSSDFAGDTFSTQLTTQIMNENDTFQFIARNSNPLIVLIYDSNDEQARVKEYILFKAPPPKSTQQLSTEYFKLREMKKPVLTKILKNGLPNSRQLDTYDRYEMITNFLEGVQSSSNNSQSQNLTSSQSDSNSSLINKTEQYSAVLDTIKSDMTNISAINTNLTQREVQVIISKSVKLISSILNDTSDVLTIKIVNKSCDLLNEIIDNIRASITILPALLDEDKKPSLNESVFVQDFSLCIANIIQFSLKQVDAFEKNSYNNSTLNSKDQNPNNSRRLRFLQDSPPSSIEGDNSTNDNQNQQSGTELPKSGNSSDTTSSGNSSDMTQNAKSNDTTSSTNSSIDAPESTEIADKNKTSDQGVDVLVPNVTLVNTEQEEPTLNISRIMLIKDKFAGALCDQVKLEAGNQTIQNRYFMLILQKLNSSKQSDDDTLSYIYRGQNENNVTINVSAIKGDLNNLSTKVDDFCLQTTFYLFDVFQLYSQQNGTMNLTQLSDVTTGVNLETGSSQISTAMSSNINDFDLKSYITITYPIKFNLTELNRTITNYTEDNRQPNESTSDNNTSGGNETQTDNSTTTNNNTDYVRRLQEENRTEVTNVSLQQSSSANTLTINLTSNETGDSIDSLVDSAVSQKIVCMAFSRQRQLWDESMCQTEIKYDTNSVQCQCTSLDNAFQGVFLVNAPLPDEVKSKSQPYIAISVFMALITVFVPFAASYLDMKDVSIASERELELKTEQRKVHSKVLDIQPLLWYWFFVHGDDVKSSQNVGAPLKKLSLGDVIKLTHPLLNIITRYEGQRKSRFFRIMPWLGQLAIFTIVICTSNSGWYNDVTSDQEVGSITSDQAQIVISAGFAGMFLLIPLPFMGQFVRRPSSETGRVKDEQKATTNFIKEGENNQISQNGAITLGASKGTNERYGTEEAMNVEASHSYMQKIASMKKMKENRKPSATNRMFAVVTIILCIAAIVISIVHLQESSLTAQRCTVASFFMGLFGSILFTHFLYSFWQYIVYIIFYEETTLVPAAAQLEQGIVDVNQSFIKKILTDSAVEAHILEQAVIKRAIYDSSRPSSAIQGKRKYDQASNMQTQFGGQGDGLSQFEPIASPNIFDGAKGLKTPDMLATGPMNKQTERGTLINHAEPDEDDEMHVYDDDNNPTHHRASSKKTNSGPRPFNFETPYEGEHNQKAPLRSANINEVNGFVVEEAIGKEAVIRASQDGIDVSPITTQRNIMQLQDGGDDIQNYTSNGRLRISNEASPFNEPAEFYGTAVGMQYQKENPNTMNVSRGSVTSQKKSKRGAFENQDQILNNSQSKIVKSSNSFVRPGAEGNKVDSSDVLYSPLRQNRPKTEEHFDSHRPKGNQAWAEDRKVETDMIVEENHALDEESAMARTQH